MSKPIIADKKELLAQSSYLTRLNSQGCREPSRNKTTFIVSVTFNSQVFPKIKDRNSVYKQATMAKVFQIIPNKQYQNLVTVLDGSDFKSNTDGVANIFRFFDAASKQLICVGYAKYKNSSGQNALQAKPTKLDVYKKKGTTELDVDTIFEHFLHDWAASFDLDELVINEGDTSTPPKSVPITKDESELWAAKKACGKDSNSLPWSTYDQGRIIETEMKSYAFKGAELSQPISNYIKPGYMLQLLGDDMIKSLDIYMKVLRSSPFTKAKLFNIFYSENLNLKKPAQLLGSYLLQDIRDAILDDARKEGNQKKQIKYAAKAQKEVNKIQIQQQKNADKALKKARIAEEKALRAQEKAALSLQNEPRDFQVGGNPNKLPPQDPLDENKEAQQLIARVIQNKGFAGDDIERLSELLAKNGLERYTIKEINNNNMSTIINSFLNIPQNKQTIDNFSSAVKQCRFRMDCKSKKQVKGTESLEDSQAFSDQLITEFKNLNDSFDSFVKETYFESRDLTDTDFVIADNYSNLKNKYINAFIQLQKQAKILRRGSGGLNYNTKAAIRDQYGLPPEEQKSYTFAAIGGFFGALAANYLYPAGRAIKRGAVATGRAIERGAVATKRGVGRGLESIGRATERRGQKMQGTYEEPLQNDNQTVSLGPSESGLYEAGGGRRKRKNKTNRVNKRKPRYYLKTLKKRKIKSKKGKKSNK